MNKETALIVLGVTLVGGALLQSIAHQEAALLGLSSAELALLGLAAGAFVKRGLE